MPLVGPGAGDAEVDLGQEPHHRDQPLEPLHRHQAAGGGEVGAARGLGLGRVVLDPARPVVGQEIRQVDHRGADPAAAVLFQRVPAWGRSGRRAAAGRGRSPRWTARPAAGGGRRGCTGCTGGRRRPCLPYFQSRCIGQISQCSCAVISRTACLPMWSTSGPPTSEMLWKWTTSVSTASSSFVQGLRLEERPAGDLRGQGREDAQRALQPVDVQPLRRRVRAQRMRPADGLEAVGAVDHVDLVPATAAGPARADRRTRRPRRSCGRRRMSSPCRISTATSCRGVALRSRRSPHRKGVLPDRPGSC